MLTEERNRTDTKHSRRLRLCKYHKNYVLKREMYFIYLGMGLVVEDASPGNPQQTATVTSSILRSYNRCECTRTENLHLFHPNSHQSTQ